MTMTLEQSLQWQSDSVATYVASLRASLTGSVNESAIDAMELLYRAGWNDCYRLATINSEYKGICADTGKAIWQ